MSGRQNAEGCFEVATSSFPLTQVRRSQVLDLLPVPNAPDKILRFRHAMSRGERFPPISAVRIGNRYLITDGHKRFQASAPLCTELPVQVWPLKQIVVDQTKQLSRWTRRLLRLVLDAARTPTGRPQLAAEARSVAKHWSRIGRSIRHLLGRGSLP